MSHYSFYLRFIKTKCQTKKAQIQLSSLIIISEIYSLNQGYDGQDGSSKDVLCHNLGRSSPLERPRMAKKSVPRSTGWDFTNSP